ncbi:hypothetical protein V2J09_015670 [Rumex salicifolius]
MFSSVKQEIQSSSAFHGVRFALFGFDPSDQNEIRSKLVGGGGVDVSQYGPNCTHVIVDKLVYDDPVCVAARKDGKTLVTSLWVRHSLDVGMPVEASPVMYKPVKDLNGISAAKNLVICLTGYLRQDREDIMTMVSLMGAQFSKPLVANRVTHLICYKFEGEKYVLAKKMKKIKLVNHRWLEDCLKAWEILPEDNYNKSGYELEMLEAEAAKDSEDETEEENVKIGGINFRTSPLGLQNRLPGTHGSPLPAQQASHPGQNEVFSTSDHVNNSFRGKEVHKSDHALNSAHITEVNQQPSRLQDSEGIKDAKSSGLHAQNTTPSSPKKDLLSSCSASKRSADSNGSKYGSLYYSRKSPNKSAQPLHQEDVGSAYKGKHSGIDTTIITPSTEHNMEERSVCPKTPLAVGSLHDQGSNDLLSYKRKMDDQSDISRGSSKSPKLESSATRLLADADILTPTNVSKGSGKTSSTERLICAIPTSILEASTEKSCAEKKLLESNGGFSTILSSVALVGNRSSNEQAQTSDGKMGTSNRLSLPETSSLNNVEKKTPQKKLFSPEPSPVSNAEKETPQNKKFIPEISLVSNAEKETSQNQQQHVNTLSTENNVLQVTKSRNSKRVVSAADKSSSRSPRMKSAGQKTLGSRPRSKMGSSANKKDSMCLSGTSPRVDTSVHKNKEAPVKASSANGLEMSALDVGRSINQHDGSILHFENNTIHIAKSIDDETEAPPELEMDENIIGKIGEVELSHNAKPTEEAQAFADTAGKNSSGKTTSEGMNEQDVSVSGADTKKLNKRKKVVGTKTRKKPDLTVLESKSVANAERAVGRQSNDENKRVLSSSGNNRVGGLAKNKVFPSVEVEKENQPVETDQIMAKPGKRIGESITTSAKMMKKSSPKKAASVVQNKNAVHFGKQPAWFILSGHKLQRKEFQKIIKRLRGRLCRDSHHWSYQATHFIVPDPVRRTEKFFAATASGSWILNTDYLTASDQAGKLLPEEPYEWHKSGLSEDGAINLEAPRKWRLLREKTGHGAFHGMRVIIYGECIAPPLDTLKRAVKAGDGTILATSPPYTRFLNSGVDFAIVSPGMPRVDIWVQEFLKHNIPCVLADYLVEYVCKPGFPLDKHVQYNTHEWAAKSFSNLVSRSEEVVSQDNDISSSEETVKDDDLRCQVCGSSERGDVMLICGTENGPSGCGVGAHIDCCDPPLKEIPEADWFCPICAGNRADDSTTGIKKKKSSKSRKK